MATKQKVNQKLKKVLNNFIFTKQSFLVNKKKLVKLPVNPEKPEFKDWNGCVGGSGSGQDPTGYGQNPTGCGQGNGTPTGRGCSKPRLNT